MYYEYFGLKQPPFRITPDTSLFYPGGNRGAILEALIYAILNGEGIVKVVGEVGSGKTMLCRMLEKELPDSVEVVYLANPSLSPDQIPFAIALELKLPVQSNSSRLYVMSKLQDYLVREHAANRQVVVFVEEAQAMPLATLEEIRLLSNLETQQNKLLQIALFGQPELDEQLARREIRQLKERITYSFCLDPFATGDIRDYLNTRLRSCGFRAGEIFDRGAVRRIGTSSRGLVRRINILADKSLLAAYAEGSRQVTSQHVKKAARDSDFVEKGRRFWWPALLAGVLLATGVSGYWWWTRTGQLSSPAVSRTTAGTVEGSPPPAVATLPAAVGVPGPGKAGPAAERTNAAEQPEKAIGDAGSETGTLAAVGGPQAPPEGAGAESPPPAPAADGGPAGDAEGPADGMKQAETPGATPGKGKLLGLSAMYQVQDVGDSRLSPREEQVLRHELETHPPEVALFGNKLAPAHICRLCWSIVYRPLEKPENL